MFTGIVQCHRPVTSAEIDGGIMRLVIQTEPGFTDGLTPGASIAVNGVCLTVIEWSHEHIAFDVIDESLERSKLGAVKAGCAVNLERAARFGDEIESGTAHV